MKVIHSNKQKSNLAFLYNKGILDKARNAQTIHQQMVQFINNPTYESLSNAKHIRDILERATVNIFLLKSFLKSLFIRIVPNHQILQHLK
jgi:hypothetical protein